MKTYVQNRKMYLMLLSRHRYFHQILILSHYCSNMQVLLSIGCKAYLYQVAKSSILNEAEFWDPSLKMPPCTKTYFEMWPSLSKVIVFFYVTLYSMMYFRRMLLLSWFYGSSQWFFKVKITFKRVNFIKK